jgi:chromosome segregation ATPase
VWQKLSHKIKALERNVSLSGGYLEQLSVQYKKQIEDLQLAVRQSGEALAAASQARELDRTQMSELQEQIGQLKVVVEEVSTRMETMGNWVNLIFYFYVLTDHFVYD